MKFFFYFNSVTTKKIYKMSDFERKCWFFLFPKNETQKIHGWLVENAFYISLYNKG